MKRWIKGSYVKMGPRLFRNNANESLGQNSDLEFAAESGDWCEQDDPSATLVTSKTTLVDPWAVPGDAPVDHWPVIDIDHECAWVPSTQTGHGHLYINKAVSFEGLIEILAVLTKHGIVQPGFLDAAFTRGYSAVRVPGLKKPQ